MNMKIILFSVIIIICLSQFKCDFDYDFDIQEKFDNPYRELKLAPWSSFRDIKKRYMELVKKYHPDKNKGESAAEKFMKIQKAFEQLKKTRKLKEEEEMDEDAQDPFFLAVQDTIYECLIVFSLFSSIYGVCWAVFKIYEFFWGYIIYITIPFIIIDKLFPHYFNTQSSQYMFSLALSALIYYRGNIWNYFRGGNQIKVDDLVNDHKKNN